jgi:hypothetical protein
MEHYNGDYPSVIQLNLLNAEENEPEIDISGLTYIPGFITRDEETALISNIDAQ